MYINKAEEIAKKQHNIDLQSSTEQLHRQKTDAAIAANPEPKGHLVNIPVTIKGVEMLSYVMRMGDKMPAFNYWPRGREIIHRLILKAATTDSIDDLKLYRTDESAIESIIFKRNQSNYTSNNYHF